MYHIMMMLCIQLLWLIKMWVHVRIVPSLPRWSQLYHFLSLSLIVEWPESSHSLLLKEGHHFRLALVLKVTRVGEHMEITTPHTFSALRHSQHINIHSAMHSPTHLFIEVLHLSGSPSAASTSSS